MRSLCVVILMLVLSSFSNAQSLSKLTIGLSADGIMSAAYNTSSSSARVNGYQNYSQYADSTSQKETYRLSFGISAWVNYLLDKNWTLQGGITYLDIGFERKQDNISFHDPIMGKGVVNDLSAGGGPRSIAYNFRYQYLQVPVFVNYHFFSSHDFQYLGYFTSGIALNVLVDHRITANLHEFVIDGENSYNLDSTGYEGRRITLSCYLGFKGEYRMDKRTTFAIQPLIGFCPISVSRTLIHSYPYYLQVNIGLQYSINAPDQFKR